MQGRIVRHKPSAEELRAIHSKFGNGSGSAISVHDVKTGSNVTLKKPNYILHIQKHKNGKKSETIIAVDDHPEQFHRVRQIVHRKVY